MVQRDILAGNTVAAGNMLMQNMVVAGEEQAVRSLLTRGDDFAGDVPPHVRLILGPNSLGISEGDRHTTMRRLMVTL